MTVDQILGGNSADIEALWNAVPAASDDFEPVPAGTYRCAVVDGKVKQSSGGKPNYEVVFQAIDQPYVNRKFWKPIWLTRNAMALAKRDLVKLGINRVDQLSQPLPTGMIAEVKIVQKVRDDHTSFNEVASFKIIASAPPADIFDVDEPENVQAEDDEPDF